MQQQINIITLGVKDAERMALWYQDIFGWTILKDKDGAIFFRLENLLLHLVPEHSLAKQLYTWPDNNGFRRFALTIGLNAERNIDELFTRCRERNVAIVREPERLANGIYHGYIADPEDNFWELAFYPHTVITDAKERFAIPETTHQ